MHSAPVWSCFAAALLAFAGRPPLVSAQTAITRVSVDSNGIESDGDVFSLVISGDGRFVAFNSPATNLVANDTNGCRDVFVHDRTTQVTVRVSVDSSGVEGNGHSDHPSISANGRYVAFETLADNFHPGDLNGAPDVFLHDRDPDGNGLFDEGNGTTTLVNFKHDGRIPLVGASTWPSISGDGHLVAFVSTSKRVAFQDLNSFADVFVRDVVAGTTVLVSVDSSEKQTNEESDRPAISADGKFVAFESLASNLVANDGNGVADVFVRDLVNTTTTRVSVDSTGVEGDDASGDASLRADGKLVAFTSAADNLVATDLNQFEDVFVRDRTAGVTELASVDSSGGQGDGTSLAGALSADGRFVAYQSSSSNLAPGSGTTLFHRDVFLHDRVGGRTYVASGQCALPPDGLSFAPSFSSDSGLVAFASYAHNLIANDGNGVADAFVLDRSVDVAQIESYGSGFPGSLNVPTLSASGDPVLGTTITLDVGSSSASTIAGFLLLGFQRASTPTHFGGTLLVDFVLVLPVAVPPSGIAWPADLPLDPLLAALPVDFQVVELDAGAQFGLSFTPGLEWRLGR